MWNIGHSVTELSKARQKVSGVWGPPKPPCCPCFHVLVRPSTTRGGADSSRLCLPGGCMTLSDRGCEWVLEGSSRNKSRKHHSLTIILAIESFCKILLQKSFYKILLCFLTDEKIGLLNTSQKRSYIEMAINTLLDECLGKGVGVKLRTTVTSGSVGQVTCHLWLTIIKNRSFIMGVPVSSLCLSIQRF